MKKIFTTILILMLLLIFSVTFIVTRSLSPYNQAKSETIEVAGRRANLEEVEDFYWYNGTETYFTVTGKNNENTPIIIVVQQNGGAIEVLKQEDSISEQTAIKQTIDRENPHKILEARIGKEKEQLIWEVSFELENGSIGYSTFSLTTGEWIRTIKNI